MHGYINDLNANPPPPPLIKNCSCTSMERHRNGANTAARRNSISANKGRKSLLHKK